MGRGQTEDETHGPAACEGGCFASAQRESPRRGMQSRSQRSQQPRGRRAAPRRQAAGPPAGARSRGIQVANRAARPAFRQRRRRGGGSPRARRPRATRPLHAGAQRRAVRGAAGHPVRSRRRRRMRGQYTAPRRSRGASAAPCKGYKARVRAKPEQCSTTKCT